ncbi:MAG: hypothetical protein B6I38_06985 [Anaerolineaceae bacterium 4572_5.1]|nr:MAG: hypothetical protein B6I38_06985 [Anaerolineaceae bacterium 4572_5.1]
MGLRPRGLKTKIRVNLLHPRHPRSFEKLRVVECGNQAQTPFARLSIRSALLLLPDHQFRR